MSQELSRDVGMTALKVSPGIAASAITWNEVVAILTAIFIVLQIAHLVWSWAQKLKAATPAPLPPGRHPEDE